MCLQFSEFPIRVEGTSLSNTFQGHKVGKGDGKKICKILMAVYNVITEVDNYYNSSLVDSVL